MDIKSDVLSTVYVRDANMVSAGVQTAVKETSVQQRNCTQSKGL